ncbi:MAG: tripartite tricarboxylate transporter receptor family protein [Betaproteobacteria bacterium]|nr:tripartite tricarboxylate transporter receptor family protein [Betaproteobacteria bacterium]
MRNWNALVAAIGCLISAGVCAQSYPAKPIRFLVGFPPGGTSDILARTIGQKLAEAVGQQVVIENRAGAGGNIGAEAAAKSAPDGYTIYMCTTSQAISASLYSKLNYDLIRDFSPITQAVNYTNLLVVNPSLPVKSVKELIALAKAKPAQLNYGTAGNGTPPHMTGELFKSYTSVKIQHVPYKGGAPAIADLLGGQITIMFDNVPPLLPHVQAGKMRPLAVTSLKRITVLRDVPTLDESGLQGFDSVAWNGVLAPAGTPKDIVAKLNAEINRILTQADVRERLAAQGADPVGTTPEQFGTLIQSEVRKWAKVVKDSGARVD